MPRNFTGYSRMHDDDDRRRRMRHFSIPFRPITLATFQACFNSSVPDAATGHACTLSSTTRLFQDIVIRRFLAARGHTVHTAQQRQRA